MSQREKVKRFQIWELNGRGQIEGKWPIPEGHQPDNYVELVYDLKGNLIQIREWFKNFSKPLVRNPKIEKGRLVESKYEDPTDNIKGTNSYEYDERGFLKARQEVDPKGKLRYRIEVKCDNRGRFVEERILDKLKRLRERHTYYYDNAGNLAKEEVFEGSDGNTLRGYFTYDYDSQRRMTRKSWHSPDGKELSRFRYKYDQFHRVTEIISESEDGSQLISKFIYDEKGRKKKIEYYDETGSLVATEDFGDDHRVQKRSDEEFPPAQLSDRELDLVEGKVTLAQLGNIGEKELSALGTIAYFHLENGRFKEAQAIFETLTILKPDDTYFLSGAGAAALSRGMTHTALSYYRRALQRDPDHIPSLGGMAEALLRQGKVEEALTTFEELFSKAKDPNHPTVQRAQALVLALTQQAAAKKEG